MDLTVLAHLELYHSRPIAPTRRLALGHRELPTDPAPGAGGVLLGGIAARFGPAVQADIEDEELELLMAQLERGMRIVQPRLRHRVQTDRVGLLRSHMRLLARGSALAYDFTTQGSALVCVLGAMYAAGELAPPARTNAFAAIRKGLRWRGPVGGELMGHLTGRTEGPSWLGAAAVDPVAWALHTLGFDTDAPRPDRQHIRRRFRQSLRKAHPDHGGAEDAAANRITELTEARRILLGGVAD